MDHPSSGVHPLVADLCHGDARIVYVEDSFEDLCGYTPEEALGRPLLFLRGPGTSATTVNDIQAAMAGKEESFEEVVSLYTRSGFVFSALLALRRLDSAEGDARYYSCIFREFKLLKNAEASFTRLLHSIEQPVVVIDGSRKILSCTDAFVDLFEYKLEKDMLGAELGALLDSTADLDLILSHLAESTCSGVPFRARTQNGKRLELVASVSQIFAV